MSTEAPGTTISGCGCMDEANARAEWPRGEVPCVCKQSGTSSSHSSVCEFPDADDPVKRQGSQNQHHNQPEARNVYLDDSHLVHVERGVHCAQQTENHRGSQNQCPKKPDGHRLEKDGSYDNGHRNP